MVACRPNHALAGVWENPITRSIDHLPTPKCLPYERTPWPSTAPWHRREPVKTVGVREPDDFVSEQVTEQMQALLEEKARLARENARLLLENAGLKVRVMMLGG